MRPVKASGPHGLAGVVSPPMRGKRGCCAGVALAGLVLLASLVPGPGAASGATRVIYGPPGTPPGWAIPLRVSGVVTVDFHGDPAAGCEQHGTCNLAGTETWMPGTSGQLSASGTRSRLTGGDIEFDQGHDLGAVAARVTRTAPDGSVHTCADKETQRGGGALEVRGGALEVRLATTVVLPKDQAAFLGTECAGPLDTDVLGLLPAAHLSAAQVAAGHRRLDLTGRRTFAAGGFAATLRSSVVLALGKTSEVRPTPVPRQSRVRGAPTTDVAVHYAIESVKGTAALTFAGVARPSLCEKLDACGLTGRINLSFDASDGQLELGNSFKGRLSRRQALERMGLVRSRRGPELDASGGGTWVRGGTVSTELARAGALACRDSASLPGGALEIEAAHRISIGYNPTAVIAGSDFATRCPGPVAGEVGGALAGGSGPIRLLRKRRFALHLHEGSVLEGAVYRGESTGDMTIVLRRTKVTVQAF